MSSWPVVPLREAAEIVSGVTIGRKTDQSGLISVPYLRVANVQDGRLDLSKITYISATNKEIEKWRLMDGDLLLTEGGDLDKLGRGTCWRNQLPNCIHQNHIFRVRLNKDNYDPDFVSFLVGSNYGKSYFLAHAKKTTGIATINQRVLGDFPLLSPPLQEQHSIALALNLQMRILEKARSHAQSQVNDTKQLANAIIQTSVGNSNSVSRMLGEILIEVKNGIGVNWSEYPVLGATRDGLAPAKEPVGKNPERYKPVQRGTVFYNPMRILIGSIAMVDDDDAPGITSPDYVVLRGRDGVVDSRWFYYWLRSPLGERCIASLARGAVRERMLFNRLAEGEITLPPYPVQVAASRALAEIRPMRQRIQAQLREIEQLPARLLAQAFGQI